MKNVCLGEIKMNEKMICDFINHLMDEEKSRNTIEKYSRDLSTFYKFLNNRELDKTAVREYKEYLMDAYAPRSVNSMLAALNSFFDYIERPDLKVKQLRIQKQIFEAENKDLKKQDYKKLIEASKNDMRMQLIIETLCATGMRVSELKFVTVENYQSGQCEVYNKGKQRIVFLPKKLIKKIRIYVRRKQIKKGKIFVTKNGKSIDRTTIWRGMKKLCKKAKVDAGKVFPHNLRHLFAKTYYSLKRDISKLADILGHSSIDTTRIYVREDRKKHLRDLEGMELVI